MTIWNKNKKEILKEFKQLIQPYPCRGSNKKTYYSAAIYNSSKNRYDDVVPYNQHRVKVDLENDYINASFIPGRKGSETYISSQAPLPHTFTEFWLMVWQYSVSLICMLTKFLEKRKVKAHCYWPGNIDDEVTFGEITIVLKNVEVEENLTTREFFISRGNETRTVYHIHYTEWPDMGLPKNTDTFLKLIGYVEKLSGDGKILAHCSAGIGRAGTLLTIHSYLDHYYHNEEKEVSQIVNEFRKQRLGMVQTPDQYFFIYKVVRDFLENYPKNIDIDVEIEVEIEETNMQYSLNTIQYLDNNNNNNSNNNDTSMECEEEFLASRLSESDIYSSIVMWCNDNNNSYSSSEYNHKNIMCC